MHPELRAIRYGFGNNGNIVSWAIQRMTHDYSLRDIAALLEREGSEIKSSEISVVLTRLKSRGKIKEIKRGSGPIPAVYRKPESATPSETESTDRTHAAESTTGSTLAP
jgi:predicted transcriptional regulator of viral defense system